MEVQLGSKQQWEEEYTMLRKQEERRGESPPSIANMNDIDHDNYQNRSDHEYEGGNPDLNKTKKPVNPMMEVSTDEIVVALQMKQQEIAPLLLRTEIEEVLNEMLKVIAFHVMNIISGDGAEIGRIYLRDLPDTMERYLLQTMDEANNTLMHYVTYFESQDLISAIIHICRENNVPLRALLLHGMYLLIIANMEILYFIEG